MSAKERSCHGEGCPRADLCRRHMEAMDDPTYFEPTPVQADGTCAEFVGNGWTRGPEIRCGGAHPPPRCVCQCQIELHCWEQRDGKWKWIAGAVH